MLNFRFVRKTDSSREIHSITAANFSDARNILAERVGEAAIAYYNREMLLGDFSKATLAGGI